MNFDIKDVKSWANRHDVKVGDIGYIGDSINQLNTSFIKGTIVKISDDNSYCFTAKRTDHDNETAYGYTFFLPLDKFKKQRPLKTLQELSDIVHSEDENYGISLGDNITIRVKNSEDQCINLLITEIEYRDNKLWSFNRRTMSEWFEEFEVLNDESKWVPFGVEDEFYNLKIECYKDK